MNSVCVCVCVCVAEDKAARFRPSAERQQGTLH